MASHLGDIMPVILLGVVVLAFVGLAVARLRARRGKGARIEPVRVPPEEVELTEGLVYACMRCGSPAVRHAKASEGIVPGGGANLTWICARCGHRGPPLEFDSPTAYRRFVVALNEDAQGRAPPGAG